jgi:hypothetical protein
MELPRPQPPCRSGGLLISVMRRYLLSCSPHDAHATTALRGFCSLRACLLVLRSLPPLLPRNCSLSPCGTEVEEGGAEKPCRPRPGPRPPHAVESSSTSPTPPHIAVCSHSSRPASAAPKPPRRRPRRRRRRRCRPSSTPFTTSWSKARGGLGSRWRRGSRGTRRPWHRHRPPTPERAKADMDEGGWWEREHLEKWGSS